MKKQLQRNYGGFIAFFSLIVSTLLGLGACANPLQGPPEERSPDGSTGVRISIVSGEARTLLPTAAFSKYVIHFATTDGGVSAPGDVTLTGTNTDVIALDAANWTITVTAYVDVEGVDVPAAAGSAQVNLSAGEFKGVPIRVSSKLDGADGSFGYNVQYPGDVHWGYLEIFDALGNLKVPRDLLSQTSENGIALQPGYYRLRVQLQTNYGMATRTEILHIYPGMETRGDYDFTEADFGSPLEVSGTVDLSGLGTVDEAVIILYRDADFIYQEAGFGEINPSGTWSWTIPVLPFNQPTDLYVELRLQLSSGFLTKRLPAPVSAYDQDVSAPGLGPFTVNQIDLSGVVNFNDLTSLGLTTIYDAWVEVYANGGIPGILGGASVNLEDGSWSLSLVTEEASLPARIVLVVDIGGGGAYIYDEIQTTLTGNRSDLDFRPGEVISAGTTINGTSIGNGYGYLFVPDTSGDYAFTLSGAGFNQTYISLSDNMGYYLGDTYGYPDAALSQFLTAGAVYYIWLDLYAPYRDFQFRVDPVSQATLGGTVDFSGILSSFAGTGVTVNYADIAVYADNSLHTPIGMAAINTGDGSWSAIVDMAGSSVPALFVITVNLSNGNTVNFQEQRSISGSNSGLTFNSGAVTVGSTVSRTTVNHYDWLLFVSTVTGDYSLKINGGAVGNRSLDLYDGETGSHLVGFGGEGELEIIRTLNAGTPYLIRVFSNYFSFESYQFRAEELQPATLSGTVSLSGLAVLPSTDINSTEIQVYAGGSSPAFLGSTMADSGGSWSLAVPASGTQAVRIVAYIHLNSGLWISAQRQDTISGNTDDLDLAPTAVSLAGGQALVRTGGAWEDLFLFVPASGGFFNLTAISGGGYTPWLTLYDTAGALLAQGSGSVYAELSAGTPYIVRVENIGSFAAYQFQLSSPITSTSIGGAVDYTGLPSSISSIISSAKVSAYLDNPAHTPIISGVSVESGGWSALIPANFIGQAARLTLTLSLSNGLMINSHIQAVLTASGLNFSPTGIPSGTVLNGKSAANGDDRFLFVPASSGTFTLQAGSDTGIYLYVYDEVAGLYIATSFGYYSTTLEVALVAGNPYVIEVFLSGNTFYDYQFYAGPPPTFGGTVDFSGLSSWNTDSAGILVFYPFDNDYNILATETVSLPGGLWSISGPAPTEDVFVALIARSTGGEGVLRIQTVVRTIGNTVIDFSPGNLDKNVASGVWHNRNASDSRGEWLLWIPDDDGDYVLDAEKTDGSMDPVMYLYDGLTGNLIAYNDDGGDNNNSRIQRSDFAAGYPYLVRVRAFGNNSGTFRFRAEEVSP